MMEGRARSPPQKKFYYKKIIAPFCISSYKLICKFNYLDVKKKLILNSKFSQHLIKLKNCNELTMFFAKFLNQYNKHKFDEKTNVLNSQIIKSTT